MINLVSEDEDEDEDRPLRLADSEGRDGNPILISDSESVRGSTQMDRDITPSDDGHVSNPPARASLNLTPPCPACQVLLSAPDQVLEADRDALDQP